MYDHQVIFVEKISDDIIVLMDPLDSITFSDLELNSIADATSNKLWIQQQLTDQISKGRSRFVKSLIEQRAGTPDPFTRQTYGDLIERFVGTDAIFPDEKFEIQYNYVTLFQRLEVPAYTP
jgi:hypothetical protein